MVGKSTHKFSNKNKYYMCYVKYLAIFACVKSEA